MARIVKEREARQNEILDAAKVLFITKGYEDTSVNEIVKSVGVAQGTFYYYFKSKNDVLNALLERYVNRVVEEIKSILNLKLNAQQKLQKMFGSMNSMIAKRNEKFVDFIHEEKNEIIHYRITKQYIKVVIPLLVTIIKQGIEEGIFCVSNPEAAAQFIIFGLNGYIHGCTSDFNNKKIFNEKMRAAESILENILGAQLGCFKLSVDGELII